MVLGKSDETVNNSFYVNLLHNVPFNTADDKFECIRKLQGGAPHVLQCPMPGDATSRPNPEKR